MSNLKGPIRLIELSMELIDMVMSKLKHIGRFGLYLGDRNEIHIFEDIIRNSSLIRKKEFMNLKHAQYITEEIWDKYIDMWTRYKIMYVLIHEMNHGIQNRSKKIKNNLKEKSAKWEYKKIEIDSVKKSERIYNKYGDKISVILKVEGIKAYHLFEEELYIGFKYNIKV